MRFPQSGYASDFAIGEISRELEPEEVPVAIRQTPERRCKVPLLFLSRCRPLRTLLRGLRLREPIDRKPPPPSPSAQVVPYEVPSDPEDPRIASLASVPRRPRWFGARRLLREAGDPSEGMDRFIGELTVSRWRV